MPFNPFSYENPFSLRNQDLSGWTNVNSQAPKIAPFTPWDAVWGQNGAMTGGAATSAPQANLAGSTTNYSAAAGGIPNVPNPVATAQSATAGNIANFNDLLSLADLVNPAVQQRFYGGIPQYGALNQQSSANIGSQLRGELPQDVVSQIAQRAAERGVATGQRSPAAYLSAIGQTSLGLQQAGEQALNASVARNTRAPFYSPAAGFVSPSDVQEAQTAANVYASAPVPAAAQAQSLNAARTGINSGFQNTRTPTFQGGWTAPKDDSKQILDYIMSQYAPHLSAPISAPPVSAGAAPYSAPSYSAPVDFSAPFWEQQGPYVEPMFPDYGFESNSPLFQPTTPLPFYQQQGDFNEDLFPTYG